MSVLLPLVIGWLFTSGLYLMLSGSLFRLVLGFLVLSQSANLFIFVSGGLSRSITPIVPNGLEEPLVSPDPLSQALILTAIVIGFAAAAYFIGLARLHHLTSHPDTPDLPEREEPK